MQASVSGVLDYSKIAGGAGLILGFPWDLK